MRRRTFLDRIYVSRLVVKFLRNFSRNLSSVLRNVNYVSLEILTFSDSGNLAVAKYSAFVRSSAEALGGKCAGSQSGWSLSPHMAAGKVINNAHRPPAYSPLHNDQWKTNDEISDRMTGEKKRDNRTRYLVRRICVVNTLRGEFSNVPCLPSNMHVGSIFYANKS